MPWIKRNLYLVISGVVALALLGLAIFFLMSARSADAAVTEELSSQTAAFSDLINRPVHPGTDKVDNISAAKQEVDKLKAFVEEVRQEFTPVNTNKVSNQEFRLMLDTTINDLQNQADRLGISLPSKDYWFTFSSQKPMVTFNSVDALTAQLEDVAGIVRILYNAKVHSIVNLKRSPVATEDSVSSTDIFARKGETNEWAILAPYEVTFTGFTTELDNVLEGLVNAKVCYIVKSIGVDKAQAQQQEAATPVFTGGNRYARAPVMAPPPTQARPVNRQGMMTILDETKLAFTLIIEVVKLRPPSARVAAAPMETSYEETPAEVLQ